MITPYDPYSQPTKQDKEFLIKKHMPLVELVVDRMVTQVPSFLSRADMTSAAMMGLVDAVNRFDESKGVLFKTFAEYRIRGAIFDEVRKLDWFTRTLREKHSRLTRTISQLESRLGRSPEEDEVAAAMAISLDEYHLLLGEVCHLGCVSLNETIGDSENDRSFLDSLEDRKGKGPVERLEQNELTRELAAYLKQLSEKERLVISLYYYEELSQKEIAEVLEISEGRVSQLHSQALIKLKVKMQKSRKGF
ncbi:MAG: RNA polymerase subunit sigma [Deltaproteobacteria bacterium RIFOXYD12_FULL_57_12]|nr:MAG: RNA polymerase subunit sigma [Deltaproteobacteria bacterium RIFOXYD12_FULL_57_12]